MSAALYSREARISSTRGPFWEVRSWSGSELRCGECLRSTGSPIRRDENGRKTATMPGEWAKVTGDGCLAVLCRECALRAEGGAQ